MKNKIIECRLTEKYNNNTIIFLKEVKLLNNEITPQMLSQKAKQGWGAYKGGAQQVANAVQSGVQTAGTALSNAANTAGNFVQTNAPNVANAFQNVASASKNFGNFMKTPAGIGIGAGVLGLALGAKLISNIRKKRKWKNNGCQNILDPSQRTKCYQYVAKTEIAELQKALNKCPDDQCRNAIQKQINSALTKLNPNN